MKRLIVIFLIVVAVAALYGIYLYNKKPVDTREQEPDYELTSIQLVREFSDNEQSASAKFNDKILLISGKVNEINLGSATVFLDASDPLSTVTCSFYTDETPQLKSIKTGDEIKVKGKCTGKLIDVVLNNCRLSK